MFLVSLVRNETNISASFPNDINVGALPVTGPLFCHQLNLSLCHASESLDEFRLDVYSPMSRTLKHKYFRIPVPTPNWKVWSDGGEIEAEVLPIPKPVFYIPGRESLAGYELVFPIAALPPLTVSSVYLAKLSSRESEVLKPSFSYSRNAWNSKMTNDILIGKNAKVTDRPRS